MENYKPLERLNKYRETLQFDTFDPVSQIDLDEGISEAIAQIEWIRESLAMQSGSDPSSHNIWTAEKIDALRSAQEALGKIFTDRRSQKYRETSQREHEFDEDPASY